MDVIRGDEGADTDLMFQFCLPKMFHYILVDLQITEKDSQTAECFSLLTAPLLHLQITKQ